MRYEELSNALRVALFNDFGTVVVTTGSGGIPEKRIKWDDGIASSMLIHPNWIWLDTLQPVIYPESLERRLEIITELQRMRVIGIQLPASHGAQWRWQVLSAGRLPLWLRELYERYGEIRWP